MPIVFVTFILVSYGFVCNSSNGDMSCVGNTVCSETQEGHKECLCPDETSSYQEVHGNCISEQGMPLFIQNIFT